MTDRSEPVAELRSLRPTGSAADARPAAMAALGAITLPSSARLTPLAPLSTGRQLGSDAVRTLLARYPLRSGDAIQLASALRFQQISLVPLKAFVAYDVKLNAAASPKG